MVSPTHKAWGGGIKRYLVWISELLSLSVGRAKNITTPVTADSWPEHRTTMMYHREEVLTGLRVYSCP